MRLADGTEVLWPYSSATSTTAPREIVAPLAGSEINISDRCALMAQLSSTQFLNLWRGGYENKTACVMRTVGKRVLRETDGVREALRLNGRRWLYANFLGAGFKRWAGLSEREKLRRALTGDEE